MGRRSSNLIHRYFQRRVAKFWAGAARNATVTDTHVLKRQRFQAKRLRTQLDTLISVADGRLALPVIGSNAFPKPHGTDWSWRPTVWRESLPTKGLVAVKSQEALGEEVTLFHDCAVSELTLRQLRNSREKDLAPFGVRMDVFRFDGSFLSLVIELPDAVLNGLTKNFLIRMDTIVEMEKPLEIFARLNINHGPNTEQLVRELPLHEEDIMVEFDLAYSKLNEKRIEKAWVDLIFEGPEMNQVILRDVTFSRRPRAQM